jgi:folate-binding protein YgfZ
MVVPVPDAIELIENTEGHIPLLDSDYWNLLQIRHGVVSITSSTTDLFTPQNLNLDLISGVSFTKGCYPGQEIVARLRYLGRVKQRLLRGKLQGDHDLRVGQPVILANATDNKSGVIVNASALAGVTTECLLSVYDFLGTENVYCYKDQPSKQITTLPLPYPLQ